MTPENQRDMLRDLLVVIAKYSAFQQPIESVKVNSPSATEINGEWTILLVGEIPMEIATMADGMATLKEPQKAHVAQHAILHTGRHDGTPHKFGEVSTLAKVVYLPHGIATNDLRVKIENPTGRSA